MKEIMDDEESGIETFKFPSQLAEIVQNRWFRAYSGPKYEYPPIPPQKLLQNLLEVCYFASFESDEGRSLRFSICCTRDINKIRCHCSDDLVESWKFDKARKFTIREVRKLATASDIDRSAIWVKYNQENPKCLEINGLINCGPSWAAARLGSTYAYQSPPSALLVRVYGPGHIKIYQGGYLIAHLSSRKIIKSQPFTELDLYGIHNFFREGLNEISPHINPPKIDPPKESENFEWVAYVNTLLHLINLTLSDLFF